MPGSTTDTDPTTTTAAATDAAELSHQMDVKLQAALQEMDEIMKAYSFDSTDQDEGYYRQVKQHSDELARNLRNCSNAQRALESLSISNLSFLRSWLITADRNSMSTHGSNGEMNIGYNGGQFSDETGYSSSNHSSSSTADMKQLEVDNDNLKKQVRSLQSQVQESRGQLKVMETRFANTNEKLIKAEERLHKEQVNKTYMESHKLDLMAEVAELRLRLQTAESEKSEYKDRYEGLQNQVLELHDRLILREREVTELKAQVNKNGYHNMNGGSASEVESLKKTVNDLMIAGQEKDRKINELRKAVNTYQRVEEIILQSQGRPRSTGSDSCSSTNDRTVRPYDQEERPISGLINRGLRQNGGPAMTSTPVQEGQVKKQAAEPHPVSAVDATPISITASDATPALTTTAATVKRSNSYDASRFNNVILASNKEGSKTPSMSRKNNVNMKPAQPNGLLSKHANGHGEADVTSDEDDFNVKDDQKKKKAGFRKFFSKLKKSSSQEALDELGGNQGAFKRGGVRATAGPRLGWGAQARGPGTKSQGVEEPRTPFRQWGADEVAMWLNNMGLNIYASECRRWNKTGKQILEASSQEVDKELRICNPLHRKKLHLALEAQRSGSRKDQLLYNLKSDWVSKWLDDIGLPQYKDQFFEARVDSRMLNYITVEDLLYMKITNALHHSSIRRGIEVLRKHNFDLSALKRRPSVSNTQTGTQSGSSPSHDPTLWTNHRVMEWLRSIDLSEYAANLRGSGVNGALIMLEPKFTVEHLASVLNIPSSKTLLRRHLNAHFVNLIGKEKHDLKSEAENGLRLEINTKVKSKKNPFKKGRSTTDYLCPMDMEPIDARAEDKRIKEAVAMYKKELNKNERQDKLV